MRVLYCTVQYIPWEGMYTSVELVKYPHSVHTMYIPLRMPLRI